VRACVCVCVCVCVCRLNAPGHPILGDKKYRSRSNAGPRSTHTHTHTKNTVRGLVSHFRKTKTITTQTRNHKTKTTDTKPKKKRRLYMQTRTRCVRSFSGHPVTVALLPISRFSASFRDSLAHLASSRVVPCLRLLTLHDPTFVMNFALSVHAAGLRLRLPAIRMPQLSRMLTYAGVCSRMLTYAHVCSRMLTYAHVCSRMLTYAAELRLRHPVSGEPLTVRESPPPRFARVLEREQAHFDLFNGS
jgi:hypothetical protein